MYRQFRLSTHRKNEFRRRRLERSCTVTSETVALQRVPELVTSPDPATDSELLVSIERDSIQSVLKVSLDVPIVQTARVQCTEQLHTNISSLCTLPQGNYIVV